MPLELSIGYETVKKEHIGDTRHLREVKLLEVSLVTMAMNPKAKVSSVKELDEVEALRARVETLETEIATLRGAQKSAPVADTPADPPTHSACDVPESYRSALAELTAFTRSRSNNG